MFKINSRDTKIRKVNDKVKNKDTVNVVVASLLSTLNTFHFLLQSFSVNCQLGLLFVVLTLCTCWNQFRQSLQGGGGVYTEVGWAYIQDVNWVTYLGGGGRIIERGACRWEHINRILLYLDSQEKLSLP